MTTDFTVDELDFAFGNPERFGEGGADCVIGLTVDRCRADRDFDALAMEPTDAVARGSRCDPYFNDDSL